MTSIKNRLSKLERAKPDAMTKYAEMSDEEINRRLWKHILPLCPKHGISDAPTEFPGAEEADRILGDSFNAILEEMIQ